MRKRAKNLVITGTIMKIATRKRWGKMMNYRSF